MDLAGTFLNPKVITSARPASVCARRGRRSRRRRRGRGDLVRRRGSLGIQHRDVEAQTASRHRQHPAQLASPQAADHRPWRDAGSRALRRFRSILDLVGHGLGQRGGGSRRGAWPAPGRPAPGCAPPAARRCARRPRPRPVSPPARRRASGRLRAANRGRPWSWCAPARPTRAAWSARRSCRAGAAALPAPAMITLISDAAAPLAAAYIRSGVRCAEMTRLLQATPNSLSGSPAAFIVGQSERLPMMSATGASVSMPAPRKGAEYSAGFTLATERA